MGKIILVKGPRQGYLKAKETDMDDIWDLFLPNPLREYGIDRVR